MIMKALPGILAFFAVIGCGSGDDGTSASDTVGKPSTSVGEDGGTRSSSPPSSIPSGGIALEPKDPNNPIYKTDPRLSGGG